MRKARRWRYYCEHCKRSGASGYHIQKHETGCTLNPNRVCRMCQLAKITQQPMAALIEALRDGGLPAIRELAGGCPACILAAIRLDRIGRGVVIKNLDGEAAAEEWNRYSDFDFKPESKKWMDDAHSVEDQYR